MAHRGVDPPLLHAWLAARSIARGLPAPIVDRGGWRVDTGGADEIGPWVFPRPRPGLRELARTITAPRHLLKLCAAPDALQAIVGPAWQIHPLGYFKRTDATWSSETLAEGYRVEIHRNGQMIEAQVRSAQGDLAARGHVVETREAFIYDRIATAPAHRRMGLGRALMSALGSARDEAVPQLLVATEDGRALYAALGWKVISPFATPSLPER